LNLKEQNQKNPALKNHGWTASCKV